jgi:hypothetical protein
MWHRPTYYLQFYYVFYENHQQKTETDFIYRSKSKERSKKVKLSLCLTKHHAMKAYWRSGGIAPRILDLGEGEW